jgi:hypothetical protein
MAVSGAILSTLAPLPLKNVVQEPVVCRACTQRLYATASLLQSTPCESQLCVPPAPHYGIMHARTTAAGLHSPSTFRCHARNALTQCHASYGVVLDLQQHFQAVHRRGQCAADRARQSCSQHAGQVRQTAAQCVTCTWYAGTPCTSALAPWPATDSPVAKGVQSLTNALRSPPDSSSLCVLYGSWNCCSCRCCGWCCGEFGRSNAPRLAAPPPP